MSDTRIGPWRVPPRWLPGRVAPFPVQKVLVERLLRVLLRDATATGELDVLRGRRVRVIIDDAGVDWCFTGTWRGLRLMADGVDAEVTFRGGLREFALVASRAVDADTLFFQRRLLVSGDTELGLSCKNLLDAVDFDRWPRPLRVAIHAVGALAAAPAVGAG